MKKMILLCIGLVTAVMLFAQSPAAFNYQAVVRDATGNVKANQDVSFWITILQGTAEGTAVFGETHSVQTNEFGLANLEIGNGTNLLGSLAEIDWGTGPYYLKIQFDPAGGTSYILMGTMQLLSVPYALYAGSAGNGFSGNYNDLTNKPTLLNNALQTTATGYQALLSNTSTSSTASGYQALWSNTTGNDNTASGTFSLKDNTTGWGNTANGSMSLMKNTTGYRNTANGIVALHSTTTGSDNTATGAYALFNNDIGWSNTASGARAIFSNTEGNYNTANGTEALYSNSSGNHNTAVGFQAGYSVNSGNNNVFLGYQAGYHETLSNRLIIDNQPRANETDARQKALIYGEFAEVPSNQMLTFNAVINAGRNRILNLGEPVSPHDATTKEYVDILLSRIAQLESYFGINELVNDCTGNVYKAVKIGTQIWMAENLKTSLFNDNQPIPYVEDSTEWSNLSTPAYCWHNNDEANKNVYGGLYNWYAIETGKLCPKGWHVPGDEEWVALELYLGMSESDAHIRGIRVSGLVGKKLKSASGWENKGNGNNFSGFSALPGGNRTYRAVFNTLGYSAEYWSSSKGDSSSAWWRNLNTYNDGVYRNDNHIREGCSVRCLKD